MMICRMRAHRQRQAVPINDRHDFQAFSTLGRADFRTPALGHREGRVDKALFFVQHSFVAKLVGNIRQHSTQNFVAAPRLKAPMHCFVVRIALRQHVPLRTGVENPKNRFKHAPCRDRLSSRTAIGNVLLRKMLPDAIPLLVTQPNHPTFIADRHPFVILR